MTHGQNATAVYGRTTTGNVYITSNLALDLWRQRFGRLWRQLRRRRRRNRQRRCDHPRRSRYGGSRPCGERRDPLIDSTFARTYGVYADGVYAYASGNVSVNSTTAVTSGDHSDAIYARSVNGGVTVDSYAAITSGNHSAGVMALAGGPVVVNSTYAATSGNDSDAVYAKNTDVTASDTMTVTSGTAITHGQGLFDRASTPRATTQRR